MISQIPQDNLYKFMAIFGLVSLIAVGVYWHQLRSPMIIAQLDSLEKIEKVNIELEYLPQELEYYRELEKSEPKAKWHYIQRMKEIEKLRAEYNAEDRKHEYLWGQSKIEGFLLLSLAAISLIIMFLGFVLWYARLQRYLDQSASNLGSENVARYRFTKK